MREFEIGVIGELHREESLLMKRGGQTSDLNHSTADLVVILETVVKTVSEISKALVPARAADLTDLLAKYTAQREEIEPRCEVIDDHLAVLKQRNESVLPSFKSKYQTDYQKPRRVYEAMTTGGFLSHGFAKHAALAISIFTYAKESDPNNNNFSIGDIFINPDLGDFMDDTITVFKSPWIIEKLRGWLYADKDAFEAKHVSLEKTLGQNPKWPVSQGVVIEFEVAEGALESLPSTSYLSNSIPQHFSKTKTNKHIFIVIYKTMTYTHILIILDGFVPASFFWGSCMFE